MKTATFFTVGTVDNTRVGPPGLDGPGIMLDVFEASPDSFSGGWGSYGLLAGDRELHRLVVIRQNRGDRPAAVLSGPNFAEEIGWPELVETVAGIYADLPPADKEYVLVSSEWYLNGDGIEEPASLDMAKARSMMPDWTTFNGYANQYVTHPLTAKPGETVRLYVVAAGPTLDTDFHVVGTIFNRAWVNGDMTQYQQGVQTVGVPAGGGAVFDVKIDEPGLYPFVSHAFAHVDLGQVGLLKVGNPKGSTSH